MADRTLISVHATCLFAGLLFVVYQSTTKNHKIGPLKNLPPHSIALKSTLLGMELHAEMTCKKFWYITTYLHV